MDLDKRKEILLLILNKILENTKNPQILNIKEFSIEREDLITENNEKLMESNYELIFKYYEKDLSHYRRASAKNYIVILLKNMCKQVGLKLSKKLIDKGITVDNKRCRIKVTKYMII